LISRNSGRRSEFFFANCWEKGTLRRSRPRGKGRGRTIQTCPYVSRRMGVFFFAVQEEGGVYLKQITYWKGGEEICRLAKGEVRNKLFF